MSSDSSPKRPQQAPMLRKRSGRTRTIPDYRALSGSAPKKSNPTRSRVVSDSRTAPVEARTVPGPSTNITPVTPPAIFANISRLHDAAKRHPSSTPGGIPALRSLGYGTAGGHSEVGESDFGPHGLDGFIEILQWLAGNGYTVDAMLGGKVDNIIRAIDFVVGSSSR
ncbi:uncharacterized protein EI90DRAFT_3133516 [Cantharellus anzutake]|uniref:uncharacterized protein n=1 Tax=Cantharellus anzutake TaxID=1750568 RepID=UPI001902FC2D|nr:uncharacterized protein EI90DRAFT_3133516 [Cantharellus anzutake]KAF8318033.1 hypothetical protein EI90DRAFT_3133516 [Cantharellus anzutake]